MSRPRISNLSDDARRATRENRNTQARTTLYAAIGDRVGDSQWHGWCVVCGNRAASQQPAATATENNRAILTTNILLSTKHQQPPCTIVK
jgi:hypothetical protein